MAPAAPVDTIADSVPINSARRLADSTLQFLQNNVVLGGLCLRLEEFGPLFRGSNRRVRALKVKYRSQSEPVVNCVFSLRGGS